eukprot:3769535-Amphidinium_carterae.1
MIAHYAGLAPLRTLAADFTRGRACNYVDSTPPVPSSDWKRMEEATRQWVEEERRDIEDLKEELRAQTTP